MKPENLYHTGIVVDDFDNTLDWFTKVAGYRWTDVVSVDQVAVTPDGGIGHLFSGTCDRFGCAHAAAFSAREDFLMFITLLVNLTKCSAVMSPSIS